MAPFYAMHFIILVSKSKQGFIFICLFLYTGIAPYENFGVNFFVKKELVNN